MQRLTMVRYTLKPEAIAENDRLSQAVFDDVRRAAPEGVAYALYRNGNEMIHVFLNLREDDSDVITALPSFVAYQKDLLARCTVPPEALRERVELLASYGLPR